MFKDKMGEALKKVNARSLPPATFPATGPRSRAAAEPRPWVLQERGGDEWLTCW